MPENRSNRPSRAAIVIGVLLIVVGACNLLDRLVPYEVWLAIVSTVRGIWGVAWPLALVVAGAYLVWASKKGKLSAFKAARADGSLRRSRVDRRIFGVCGGIANYFAMDPTVVRIIAVALLLVLTPTAFLAYVVLALLVPSE